MSDDSAIYLDNNATTKPDQRVIEAIMPYITDHYGNASSSHEFGLKSNEAVKKSRGQLASLIGSSEHEIFFTSGATESINIVLKGIVENSEKQSPHIITVSTEHPAILDTCRFLETKGVKVTYLAVLENGLIELSDLEKAITQDTVLISVMMVNNETGVIQPMKEISEIAHRKNIPFMSDCTQAVGKIPVNVYDLGIDILCFSGHKFYCPKGIGGLFLRSKRPIKINIPALLHGGGWKKISPAKIVLLGLHCLCGSGRNRAISLNLL